MLLIGMFDSPFVRRVAVSMKLLGLPFEHANWSVGRDFDRIREYNPLGRVPTLVLRSGESLMVSGAILHYLAEPAGRAPTGMPFWPGQGIPIDSADVPPNNRWHTRPVRDGSANHAVAGPGR